MYSLLLPPYAWGTLWHWEHSIRFSVSLSFPTFCTMLCFVTEEQRSTWTSKGFTYLSTTSQYPPVSFASRRVCFLFSSQLKYVASNGSVVHDTSGKTGRAKFDYWAAFQCRTLSTAWTGLYKVSEDLSHGNYLGWEILRPVTTIEESPNFPAVISY